MTFASNAYYERTARTKIQMSRHAAKRDRQRAIPADCVPLLITYGEKSHDGHGGIRYLMTAKSVAALIRAVGYTKRLEGLAGCYAVVSAENPSFVITLGHRHE